MRVYVVVRKDLRLSSPAVQGGHALIELGHFYPIKDWILNHKTLIYLGVNNQNELLEYFNEAPFEEKVLFKEPDLDNEPTAFAVLVSDKSNFFKRLNLL
jgi:hypothetical protein